MTTGSKICYRIERASDLYCSAKCNHFRGWRSAIELKDILLAISVLCLESVSKICYRIERSGMVVVVIVVDVDVKICYRIERDPNETHSPRAEGLWRSAIELKGPAIIITTIIPTNSPEDLL